MMIHTVRCMLLAESTKLKAVIISSKNSQLEEGLISRLQSQNIEVSRVNIQQYLLRKPEKAPKTTNKYERKADSSACWFRARAKRHSMRLSSY